MRENYEEYKGLVNDCLIGYMPYETEGRQDAAPFSCGSSAGTLS